VHELGARRHREQLRQAAAAQEQQGHLSSGQQAQLSWCKVCKMMLY
jgi:hypothetical protein